ncbi:YeeE/YedE thiosulfate transporter family protein [Novosphingobium sp.]|uniref:YeeE/YedE thiosulfate transporter family protein n=1 Tax=Novosphingobium sp. TaxID=1874826 RepID=UPI001DB2857A|nr:YeeE/YedE thiosulfate transporter family protein [Novosphingobium sp.]MBX9664175.1 YeeE/YedE family protein [Novosphingobium sp.]
MDGIALISPVFFLAACCAAVMGYAIQRSGTCMVTAIDEFLDGRRTERALALVEAGLWVSGSILVWRQLGGHTALPVGYPPSAMSALGGVLLGLGALLAGACMFGAIARIGSGDWAFVLTPLGYFLACAVFSPRFGQRPPMVGGAPLLDAGWLIVPLTVFAIWRALGAWRAAQRGELAAHVWHPHQATTVIGIAFSLLLILVGPWAYTSALLALAEGHHSGLVIKLALFVVLLAGAIVGGWNAGSLRMRLPPANAALRCLGGGALMGCGSLLVPGGNDELVLLGLPLLQPYAALAAAAMALSIVLGRLGVRS